MVLFIVLLLGGGVLLAGDKAGPCLVRLTEADGTTLQGKAQMTKDGIEIETTGGTKKVAWRRVTELEELEPDSPPPEIERTRDRATFDERSSALAKRTDEPRVL